MGKSETIRQVALTTFQLWCLVCHQALRQWLMDGSTHVQSSPDYCIAGDTTIMDKLATEP
jgi:hypothetical protein